MLLDEKAALMVAELEPWPPNAPLVKEPDRIQCWEPDNAKEAFLARFVDLTAEYGHQNK
ncbi:hypothetical protein [Thalassovita aquimarina]|uniref:Uncharacterized protein n=1 Tax=Thalassovita aquimarina TaxID=2785917 RepID=A0ABS5HT58_9RHOB|nr:hypothetical protein [Thalassovita aquimarina]MBR9652088.1 hypothetical protein [Thalassovita aquimarina]